jgi:hypothetical protein
MRLRIGKAGKYLHLKPGTALQVALESPVWFGDRQPDELADVKSYSLIIPNDAHNRHLLDRPDLLDNPAPFLSEPGWSVYYDGWEVFTGRLEVEDTEAETDFRITFIGGLAGNLGMLKIARLPDLFQDDVRQVGPPLAHAAQVKAQPGLYDYLFPSIRTAPETTLDEESRPQQYEYCNRWVSSEYLSSLPGGGAASLIPFFRVHYVLRKMLEAVGYTMGGAFDSGEFASELRNLILFNNVTLDRLESVSEDGGIQIDNVALAQRIDVARHLPAMMSSTFLKQVASTLGMSIFIRPQERRIILSFNKDLLNSPIADWTSKVDPRYTRRRTIEDIPTRFQYEHPSADQYPARHPLRLNNLREDFRFRNYSEAQLGLTPDDLGKIVYVESVAQYFEFVQYFFGEPVLASLGKSLGIANQDDVNAYQVGTKTLYLVTQTEQSGLLWDFRSNAGQEFMPVWYGGLVSPWLEGQRLDEAALLFYRFDQFDVQTGQDYPLASPNNWNREGNKTGQLSLYFDGEDSIYEKLHRPWLDAIRTMRPVAFPTRLSAPDLANLDWRNRIRIGPHLYFLKSVQATLSAEKIEISRAEYIQIA